MNERRMSNRLPVNFPAALKAGKLTAEGSICQISANGMLFECSKHFDTQETGVFELLVFDKEPPIALEGKVIYKIYHNDGQNTTLRYGVQFTSLDNYINKNAVERIISFVTARGR